MPHQSTPLPPRHLIFLRDVLILTFSAFGGPQAHIGLMLQMLVNERRYLSEEELIELTGLCQILPGPTSTQIITAIGYKRGGVILALLTLAIWVLPAALIMTCVALFFTFFETQSISIDFLKYLQPVAIGFIAFAGYQIGSKVIKTSTSIVLLIIAALITVFVRSPWVFPIILIIGGIVTNFTNKEKAAKAATRPKINWLSLILFFAIFILVGTFGELTKYKPLVLFENFYRFGSLIFGGGQVLVPMMHEQFVTHKDYMTSQEFLSGFGIVQALPGPVFSFATFTGGLALKDMGTTYQLLGCLIGTVGIFLPGTLLIFFVYPFWEYIKRYTVVKRSLEGVNAVAVGLVVAAAIILFRAFDNLQEALAYKKLMKSIGFNDAFIAFYRQGERISLKISK